MKNLKGFDNFTINETIADDDLYTDKQRSSHNPKEYESQNILDAVEIQ